MTGTEHPMPLHLRRAGLAAALCLLLRAAAWASPAGAMPSYWPFQSLLRGGASVRDLGGSGQAPRTITLHDVTAFRAFWVAAHRYRDTYDPGGPPPRPPRIDFSRRMAVVVVGRAGSAFVKVQKMWTLTGNVLVVGLFNPSWPDIATDPQRVPYEIILAPPSAHAITTFERPAARALQALTTRAMARVSPPLDGGRSPLDDERVERLRQLYARRGQTLLRNVDALPRPRTGDPEEPYIDLLRGTILARLLDRPDDARRAFQRVVTGWPGTVPARLAKSRIERLDRQPRDLASRKCLDDTRRAMATQKAVTEGHAKRWFEVAQEYEYLTSMSPLTLYIAARCYVEAARDASDPDRAQNALLQAAALYAQELDLATAANLCWMCVRRYPDAASTPGALARLGMIGWEQHHAKPEQTVCQAFLRAFPRSRNAGAVRKMLVRAAAEGR